MFLLFRRNTGLTFFCESSDDSHEMSTHFLWKIKKKWFKNDVCYLDGTLIHTILNRLPYNILEESNFNFRYVRLWDLYTPREKWLNYLQTVETLIRRRVLRCLIWICTVCQLPFYGYPDYNGLMIIKSLYPILHLFHWKYWKISECYQLQLCMLLYRWKYSHFDILQLFPGE